MGRLAQAIARDRRSRVGVNFFRKMIEPAAGRKMPAGVRCAAPAKMDCNDGTHNGGLPPMQQTIPT